MRLIIAAVPLAFSIYQVVSGVRLVRRGRRLLRARSIGSLSLAGWTRSLLQMGVFAADPDVDPEMRSQVILNWIQVAGRVMFGRGAGQVIGILPGMATSAVLLVVVLKGTVPISDIDLLVALMGSFALLSVGAEFASSILGQALGMLRGYAALTVRSDGSESSPLAVPNALGDYRSAVWTPLLLMPTVITIALAATAIVVAHAVSVVSGEEFAAGIIAVATGIAVLCATASLAIFCAGEIAIRRIAAHAPVRFSWNAALAGRTDGAYRRVIIGALTSAEAGALGISLGLALFGLGITLGDVPSRTALAAILLSLLLMLLASWVRLRVWRMRGRLGGRYTGWPRTRRASTVHPEKM